jgi:hypothetical protein
MVEEYEGKIRRKKDKYGAQNAELRGQIEVL